MDRNIFGGFAPVKSVSKVFVLDPDTNLKGLIFTLQNPQNFPARKFALKAENGRQLIRIGDGGIGPSFFDISMNRNSNAVKSRNTTSLGRSKPTIRDSTAGHLRRADFPRRLDDPHPLIIRSLVVRIVQGFFS
jgi:hypothetical protein